MVAAARFGAAFIGRVANPGEMLHLFRRPKRIRATGGASSSAAIPAVLPSQLGTAGLEELVKEALATSKAAGRGLVTVSQDSLVTAVHRYTHNEDAKAIKEAIETAVETRRHKTNAHAAVKEANLLEVSTAKLRSIVKEANAEMTALEEEEFAQMSPEEREREAEARRMQAAINHEAGEAASVSDDASAASDAPKGAKGKGAKARAPAKPRAKAAAKKAPTKRGRRGSDEEEEEEEEDDDDYESAPAPKRAAAARKPKAASPRRRPSEDDVVEIGDDEEEVRPPPPSRGASKAKAAPKAPVIPAALAPPARGAAAPIWPGAVVRYLTRKMRLSQRGVPSPLTRPARPRSLHPINARLAAARRPHQQQTRAAIPVASAPSLIEVYSRRTSSVSLWLPDHPHRRSWRSPRVQ